MKKITTQKSCSTKKEPQSMDSKPGSDDQKAESKSNFILDTNVMLHDPNAILSFGMNDVIIPLYSIEELDGFKMDLSELGRNARVVGRVIDAYREIGLLSQGVALSTGGTLRVLFSNRQLPTELGLLEKMDHKILALALELKEKEPHKSTILVTKDTNLRIKADVLGVEARDYDSDKVTVDEIYTGIIGIEVAKDMLESFHRLGYLMVGDLKSLNPEANMFVQLICTETDQHILARIDTDVNRVVPVRTRRDGMWGIESRNREQGLALDLLLDDRIKLVTLVGKAGTGKTLLSVAAGLHKVMDECAYQRLLVTRPIFPLGKDLGYLPGGVEAKLNPWMQPIFDNVDYLLALNKKDMRRGLSWHELIKMDLIEIEPLTYIRGRSIPNQFVVIDEAQNLTPHEVKTIITRAGYGTKIILTGDLYQIDNPFVDASSNGLAYTVNRFKGNPIYGHLILRQGERSELAELASDLL